MCIRDSIHAAGCNAVSVEKSIYGVTKIFCFDNNSYKSESAWVNNEFYGIAFGSRIPDDVTPICTDPFLIMTTAERD